jgi:hypothetical protein
MNLLILVIFSFLLLSPIIFCRRCFCAREFIVHLALIYRCWFAFNLAFLARLNRNNTVFEVILISFSIIFCWKTVLPLLFCILRHPLEASNYYCLSKLFFSPSFGSSYSTRQ